jgi:predicted F0F1-ATPase subunit
MTIRQDGLDNERPQTKPRKEEKQSESFWALVAQATTLGWNLVVPIVGGVLLGRYLDDRFDKDFTWTLTLLLMGVAVAFNSLYGMYIEHGNFGGTPKETQNQRPKEAEEGEDDARNK